MLRNIRQQPGICFSLFPFSSSLHDALRVSRKQMTAVGGGREGGVSLSPKVSPLPAGKEIKNGDMCDHVMDIACSQVWG